MYVPSLWYFGELMFLEDQETPDASDSTNELGNDNNENSVSKRAIIIYYYYYILLYYNNTVLFLYISKQIREYSYSIFKRYFLATRLFLHR